MCDAKAHVRFTPESRHARCKGYPLWPKADMLFGRLIGNLIEKLVKICNLIEAE